MRNDVIGALAAADKVVEELSSGGAPCKEASTAAVSTAAVALAGLVDYSCSQIDSLKQEVGSLKQEVGSQGQRITSLEQTIVCLEGDRTKLLLREMGTQTVNKITRIVLPGTTPYEASYVTLHDLRIELDNKPDACIIKYRDIMQAYPNLQRGVSVLCASGRPVAHPIPPVTEHQLRAEIATHVDSRIKPQVEQVLQCLVDLAAQLGEPLFVPTV